MQIHFTVVDLRNKNAFCMKENDALSEQRIVVPVPPGAAPCINMISWDKRGSYLGFQ